MATDILFYRCSDNHLCPICKNLLYFAGVISLRSSNPLFYLMHVSRMSLSVGNQPK